MKTCAACHSSMRDEDRDCPECGATYVAPTPKRDAAAPLGRWGDGSPIAPPSRCEYGPCGNRTQMSEQVDGRRINICEACLIEWRRKERFRGMPAFASRRDTTAWIREYLAKSKVPNRDWANKILDRHKAGERLQPYVLQCALEATGDAPAPYATGARFREPGEDE